MVTRSPRRACKRCLNYLGMRHYMNRTAVPAGLLWGLHLDGEGVCNVCRAYERALDPALIEKERLAAVALGRRRGALVAFSGGKDSLALLHLATRTTGMPVQAFFFDSGYTVEGVLEQVKRLCQQQGVPLHVGGLHGRPATVFRRQVERSRLSDPHPCENCSAAIGEQVLALCDQLGTQVILNGSNYFARWEKRVHANVSLRTPGGRSVLFSHFLFASRVRLPEVARRVAALGARIIKTDSVSSNCEVPARVQHRLGQQLGHVAELEDLSLEVMVGHRTRRSALLLLQEKAPDQCAFFKEVYGLG